MRVTLETSLKVDDQHFDAGHHPNFPDELVPRVEGLPRVTIHRDPVDPPKRPARAEAAAALPSPAPSTPIE